MDANGRQANHVITTRTIIDQAKNEKKKKQGRIHGYLSRVRVGRGGEKKAKCDGPTDQPTDRRTEWVIESRARD